MKGRGMFWSLAGNKLFREKEKKDDTCSAERDHTSRNNIKRLAVEGFSK